MLEANGQPVKTDIFFEIDADMVGFTVFNGHDDPCRYQRNYY
jgi:hypothetical protein